MDGRCGKDVARAALGRRGTAVVSGMLPSTYRSFPGSRSRRPLAVQGVVPDWLSGVLYRNGPGRYDGPAWEARHAFDGLALLQRFAIRGQQVQWSARFLDSPLAAQVEEGHRTRLRGFGQAASRTWFDIARDLVSPRYSDNANVAIVPSHGRLLALTETPFGIEVDPQTLATRGRFTYGDERSSMEAQTTTAHPHHDRARDEIVNLATRFKGRERFYRLWAARDGARREFARLPVARPAYLHSFGLSPGHAVVAEFPLLMNPFKLLLGDGSYRSAFDWAPASGTRLRVVERHDGRITADGTIDACFAFHHVHAWDEGTTVVVDLLTYPDAAIMDAFFLDRLAAPDATRPAARYTRLRIDCASGRISQERLFAGTMEFVSVVPGADGAPCHGFAVGSTDATPGGGYDQLWKLDYRSQRVTAWREPGGICGEPLFVAKPGGRSADDGVVLALCHMPRGSRDLLVLLDGQSFRECARAILPEHVPYGFHGCFLPA